jgi:limonene 1,2-monooxygenase
MMPTSALKFGVFMSPLHSPTGNPTRNLQRDVELCQYLDRLGFDEVWVGEHHSAGWECVGSPEVFLSYVAASTHNIRLGTGVVSLPYHNPYMVASRATLLDHLSHGRFSLGMGPGAFLSDARQFALDPAQSRRKLEEGAGVIRRLLAGEVVTETTDWYQLSGARLQLLPYNEQLEIVISQVVSPSGPVLAAKLGASLLALNATDPGAIGRLAEHWALHEETAAQHGHSSDRGKWRIVAPYFVAETEEEAFREVERGIVLWSHYLTSVGPAATGRRSQQNALVGPHDIVPRAVEGSSAKEIARGLCETGFAVIGTPDQVEHQIRRLQEQTGGFGVFLNWQADWATPEATFRSYRLFADEVIPRFRQHSSALVASQDWVVASAAASGAGTHVPAGA